jgi:hypothetical protein
MHNVILSGGKKAWRLGGQEDWKLEGKKAFNPAAA